MSSTADALAKVQRSHAQFAAAGLAVLDGRRAAIRAANLSRPAWQPRSRIEPEAARDASGKVEHVEQRSGLAIEGDLADAGALEPDVFDEAQHRRLVAQLVAHVVALGIRGYDEQREPRPIAAARPRS